MASITPPNEESIDPDCPLASLSRGANPLRGIPKFPSFHEHRSHILIHMAAVLRSWARTGFTEGTSGHVSVRDPEHPHLMWMNPIGRHFALMNGSDMVCLTIDEGKIVGGNRLLPINNPGFYIHSEIYKSRPTNAICHAHTIAARAWCSLSPSSHPGTVPPLDMLTQDACTLHGCLAIDNGYAGLATAADEGIRIAKALGTDNKAVLLANHGIVTVGHSVDEAAFLLGLVDRCCDIQLRVEAAVSTNTRLVKSIIPDHLAQANAALTSGKDWLYEEAQPDVMLEIELAGHVISRGLQNISMDLDKY